MAISSNVDQLFNLAVQFHSEGNLPQALQAYEQVLQQAPGHFDALHNTGIAAFQSGNFEVAVRFIRAALAVDPQHAPAHNNLGNALREMQLMEEALRSYERALALAAGDANTHFNRAVTLQSLMRSDEALQSYEQALSLDAGDDQAWNNRATLLWQARQYDLALVNVEQALALNPHNIEAYNNRGNILLDMERPEQAEESYRQALALLPDYAEAHFNLGRLQLSEQRWADALRSLELALGAHPQHLPAQRQRAIALRQLGEAEQARRADEAALALQAELIAAYRRRGAELEQLLHYESAAALYAAALELDGGDAELLRLHAGALEHSQQQEQVLSGLRQALQLKSERAARAAPQARPSGADLENTYESARLAYEKLTKLAPNNALAYLNLGVVQQGMGLRDQALANFDKAIAMSPDTALSHFNRGLLLLARGDYERGWQGYEWRWKARELPMYKTRRHFLKPQWSGRESLKGKTILLHAEQGFGDGIQFCRFASMVKQRGARVVLEIWNSLVPLMETLADVDQIVATRSPLPAFDYHIPLMSLPLALNIRVDTIPAPRAYLSSDPALREQWLQVLGEKKKPRIGLVWSGRNTHANDHNRSLPLSTLAPLLSDRYEFICLQKEIRDEEQALLDTLPIRQVSDLLHSFSDTAALCDVMDVVITVDTSVAHLSGALGQRTWVMLPTPFEWRWLEHGDSSPWYPSATLYRQREIGDWTPVVAAVAAQLAAAFPA